MSLCLSLALWSVILGRASVCSQCVLSHTSFDISSYENLQRTTLLNLFTGFLYRSVYINCTYQKAFELPPTPTPFMFNIWYTILGLYWGICYAITNSVLFLLVFFLSPNHKSKNTFRKLLFSALFSFLFPATG